MIYTVAIAVEARIPLRASLIPSDQLARLRFKFPEIDRAFADVAVEHLRAALTAIEELNLLDLREVWQGCEPIARKQAAPRSAST